MVELRSFDAFPKIKGSYKVKSVPDLMVSITCGYFFLFMMWLCTTDMMGFTRSNTYAVDKGLQEKIQVNFDVSVASGCDRLTTILQDYTGDFLFVDELVQADVDTSTPLFLGKPEGTEWCRFHGIFETNRVPGRLIVTDNHRRQFSDLDYSHYIHELSFGDYYPGAKDPLDGVYTENSAGEVVLYFLRLVPTTVQALGLSIDLYQFAVTPTRKDASTLRTQQGIHFSYDFDPIRVTMRDGRMTFFAWLFRVANIAGGVVFAWRWASRARANKYVDKSEKGLLDRELED